ncbi:MAG: hypothetical protein C0503_04570 [Gemmatimonas sp.]|nr:hypothetical protein [Gemmatimonas sp.]
MIALLLGSVLAVAALAFVMWPLLKGGLRQHPIVLAPEQAPEASALEALREIEFDQATGKLSPEDYATLKATYTPRALAELRAREAGDAAAATPAVAAARSAADDAAEALIARVKQGGRSCANCGPRPESDAAFCSDCGRMLGAGCVACGASIAAGAKFCVECGAPVAAAS